MGLGLSCALTGLMCMVFTEHLKGGVQDSGILLIPAGEGGMGLS